MMSVDEKRILVQQFLTCTMDDEEFEGFLNHVKNDTEIRSILDNESGVESLLHGENN